MNQNSQSEILYRAALNHLADGEILAYFGARNPEDLSLKFLARGEYNINYEISYRNLRAVLRLNTGSQMHLDNQIRYEYETLKILEKSGVTPKPILYDDSCTHSQYGMLMMEYISGRWLEYEKDFRLAARLFARIHQIKYQPDTGLIATPRPATAILDECFQMSDIYLNSPAGNYQLKKLISTVREKIGKLVAEYTQDFDLNSLVLNNTEVNSSNFLFDEQKKILKLVDWEKAVFSVPAQDLSHFVVPTTTLWKTDFTFTDEQVNEFLEIYCTAGPADFSTITEQMRVFIPLTCLRGVTWCTMAYMEYLNPDRPIKNQSTFYKIQIYTDPEFISSVFRAILGD